MSNTLKFGNGEWYGKEGTILAYNSENNNYKPLPFTFDRASSATRVNKDGLIETVGADQPRVDYLNDSKGALKLEPSRTNLLPYSEDFSQWNALGDTSIEGGYLAPDGSNTAYKVLGGSSLLNFNDVSNETQTRTIWARTVSGTGQAHLCSFNGNTNNLFSITTEWQRFEVNGTTTATGATNFYAVDFRGSTDLTELIIWGAQLEEGSYATSYIPTQGSAVTRIQDVTGAVDITPLNIGNSYTLFLDANLNVNDSNNIFSSIFNSSDVLCFTVRNFLGGIRVYNNLDGSYPTNTTMVSSNNKFVIRINGNSYKIFGQGSSLSGTLTTQRDLGSLNFYGQNTELKINNFTIDNTALSDAECQALVN